MAKKAWEKLKAEDFPNYHEFIRARNRLRSDFKSQVKIHLRSLNMLGCDIAVSPQGKVVLDTKLLEKDVDPDLITRKIGKR